MHCQGDMEKADMVDGKILSTCLTEALAWLWFTRFLCSGRYKRECLLDAASWGEPKQDVRVSGALLQIQRPAHSAWYTCSTIHTHTLNKPKQIIAMGKSWYSLVIVCVLRVQLALFWFPTPHPLFQMVTLMKMQSITCVTVSPVTNFEVMRPITREESLPETTPCRSAGVALRSG